MEFPVWLIDPNGLMVIVNDYVELDTALKEGCKYIIVEDTKEDKD